MSNLSAKVASALLLGAVVGAASTALPPSKAHAADNCLLEPQGATPQGKHWHYRTERGTGRKCWYLRGEDEQSADAPSAVPDEKPAQRTADAAPSRSIADAHAEIPQRARAPVAQVAPSAWPNAAAAAPAANPDTPAANVAPSPLASRWPQGSDAASAANPQPEASQMVADATDPDATTTPDSTAQAAPPPSLAAVPADRNTGSIQKLLMVAGGALALAGLTGSAVYRLGRRRKRNDWLRERTNWQSIENPNNPPWVEPVFVHGDPDVPDLDEARETAAHADAAHAFAADESGDRVEKIEDFLARLTEQLHAELDSMPRAERDVRAAS